MPYVKAPRVKPPSTVALHELIGMWGFDHGYFDNPKEKRLTFLPDGSGRVSDGNESIDLAWRYDPPTGLELSFANHWYGPFYIRTERKQLPLGEFTVLISDGALLPFGLRHFQRIDDLSEALLNVTNVA